MFLKGATQVLEKHRRSYDLVVTEILVLEKKVYVFLGRQVRQSSVLEINGVGNPYILSGKDAQNLRISI